VFCLACSRKVDLLKVQEFPDYDLVTRRCPFCSKEWILKYQDKVIVMVTQVGEEVGEDYGFDYTCPHCHFSTYVATVYRPPAGWSCLNCGKYIPNECLKPRAKYELPPVRRFVSGAPSVGSMRRRQRVPGYQRTPRTSRPVPAGAVGVAAVAEKLGIPSKKLRSWLRKVGWRSSAEAGSSWVFSREEAEEVIKHFGR